MSDIVTIESVADSVLSEYAREVHPSNGESIHPRTDGPKGSIFLGHIDRGSIHPGGYNHLPTPEPDTLTVPQLNKVPDSGRSYILRSTGISFTPRLLHELRGIK